MMFRWGTPGIAALVGLLAGGCISPDEGSGGDGGPAGGTIELFSWWTSGGEQEALRAVVDVHEARIPSAKVTNAAVAFANKAREELQARMVEGVPPDMFQANIGADLFKWVLFNSVDDSAAKVESLQGLAEAEGWSATFDPTVLEAGSFEGKLYGLPVNVHRINSLFFRKDLFEKHGLSVPSSIAELLSLCETIATDEHIQEEAPDGKMACLGLGNLWEWTLPLVTFEMIFPAVAGAEYYESFWLGQESADDPQIEEAVNVALQLYCGGTDMSDCGSKSYFNTDVDIVDWDDGVGKLIEKKAMMAPMGDWAKGYLEAQGLVPGQDFEVVPFPGSAGTFVFTADTFPLPIGAPNRRGAVEFFKTFASKEGQIAFNRLKGSISPRTDIEPSEFDVVTQETMAAFSSSTKAKALSGLLPQDVMPDLAEELKLSFQMGSTEIIMNYLRGNYGSVGR